MPSEEGNKLSRVEELKTKLFSRNFKPVVEHRDNFSHPSVKDVPDSWDMRKNKFQNYTGEFFKRTSVFRKFFIFSICFFVIALAYSSYMFFGNGNIVSNDNIDISILGNAFTSGGEELPLQIGITNKNSSALELTDLVVEYPKGTGADLSGETERIRESIGTIAAGSIKNENVKIVLFGEQGSVRPIKVTIEYRVEGSNAIFVKDKMYEVSINSTPIDLTATAPDTASPNQDITLGVKATLNATQPAAKILLRVDYPIGFQFTSATPAPSFGNNIWNLGDLAPGASQSISINGKMLDVSDGEDKIFRIYSGSQSDTDKSAIGIIYNSLGQTISIKKPLVEAKLFIGGVYQREFASSSNTPIHAEIRWANNLDTSINNMKISAKITGNALDRNTIQVSQGFYNSSQNTIVWDQNSVNGFGTVNPGDSGSVSFSMSPLSLFSSSGGFLVDPSISVEVSIAGEQTLSGFEPKALANAESSVIKIISDAGLAAKALYYSGPFQNTGPIPPVAEKVTTYTVTWSLSNSANNISKAAVTATLPSWVDYANKVIPSSEDITYNPATKTVVWNVGNIPKGTGITTAGREASFMISFTPSLSQVNTAPTIINDAILTAHDDFANVDIRVNKAALTTRLSNDPAFPSNGDRVTQ